MNETFTVKQDMLFFEFLKACFYQTSKLKLIRRLFFISIILGLVNIILLMTANAESQRDWNQVIFEFLICPLFLFLFFAVCITIGAVLLRVFRPNHFKNVTYTFTHWGMEKTGTDINFTRPWSKFQRFRESQNFMFLYISESDAHIIQKRMFKSDDEIEGFRQLIFRHLKNA